jgi:hypothetical protein
MHAEPSRMAPGRRLRCPNVALRRGLRRVRAGRPGRWRAAGREGLGQRGQPVVVDAAGLEVLDRPGGAAQPEALGDAGRRVALGQGMGSSMTSLLVGQDCRRPGLSRPHGRTASAPPPSLDDARQGSWRDTRSSVQEGGCRDKRTAAAARPAFPDTPSLA